jgi:hypothetical protein
MRACMKMWRSSVSRTAMKTCNVLTASGYTQMCSLGLQLESHSDFVTVRSRSGVTSGCWVYEVKIQSAGLQQVGWVTSHCHLSEFSGVGDTPMSVAFDGERHCAQRVRLVIITCYHRMSWFHSELP